MAAAQIWLEVRESNIRARVLYERWGFEAVGLRKAYYPAAHGQREHALVMRWSVPPVGEGAR
jgi:ribosomal-protein-alanine N-acetyltransferase